MVEGLGASRSGKLLVVAMDFSKIISDFDTKSSVPPEQLAWCGDDSVVLYIGQKSC